MVRTVRRICLSRVASLTLIAVAAAWLTFLSRSAVGEDLAILESINSASYFAPDRNVQASSLLVEDILARLLPPDASEYTRYQFAVNLKLADISTLQTLSGVATFDEAEDILLADSKPQEAIAGTSGSVQMAIGSTAQDYVYTAVEPCRVADSRPAFGGPGTQLAGSTRSFFVYGSDMSSQGGNPAGCPSPKGEPRAVHINVTVVGGGAGHLRVFPANTTRPNASFVNFENGQVVANAGVIRTTFAIGPPEVSVYAAVNAEVIIDVLGYFHEVDAIDPSLLTTIATGVVASSGTSVASVSCPVDTTVISANCHCDNANGTRNFGILFGCNIAGNGAVVGCFADGLTFNPSLPDPLATVNAVCAAEVPAAGAVAGATELFSVSKPTSDATSDPELMNAFDNLRYTVDKHTELLRAK